MSRNTNDIGYTYVEIDLPAQRLVVYQDGTPVADTGISAGSGTETGVYMVGEMKSPAEVNGGTVNFWIPYKENAGIVDNPNLTQSDVGFWRKVFLLVSDLAQEKAVQTEAYGQITVVILRFREIWRQRFTRMSDPVCR